MLIPPVTESPPDSISEWYGNAADDLRHFKLGWFPRALGQGIAGAIAAGVVSIVTCGCFPVGAYVWMSLWNSKSRLDLNAKASDIAKLEDEEASETFLVEIVIRRGLRAIGVDRGVLWVESDLVRFFGDNCDFCLCPVDWMLGTDPPETRLILGLRPPNGSIAVHIHALEKDGAPISLLPRLHEVLLGVEKRFIDCPERKLPPVSPPQPNSARQQR